MKPFTTHTGIVATLNRANVDTDAIIPKQFLKSIKRSGFGPNAFFDWRYTAEGKPDAGLNFTTLILMVALYWWPAIISVAAPVEEHAVWALVQDGYRVIIAAWKEARGKRLPAFADIFRINATKNGLLLIELSEDQVSEIFELVQAHGRLQATVDLIEQQVVFHGTTPKTFSFDIEAGARKQLLEGLDDIDQTLQYESDITRFEKTHNPYGL